MNSVRKKVYTTVIGFGEIVCDDVAELQFQIQEDMRCLED